MKKPKLSEEQIAYALRQAESETRELQDLAWCPVNRVDQSRAFGVQPGSDRVCAGQFFLITS